jgi:serine O-acetyltransferase
MVKSAFTSKFPSVLLCRLAHWFALHRMRPIGKLLACLNFVVFGIEISLRCRIGGGLILPHTQGTVIGASSIGRNAIIFQGVTLGAKGLGLIYDEDSRPAIGDGVMIGAGAKVLGGIRIGSGVRIGANAVVLASVPDNAVAVGVPATFTVGPAAEK